MFNPPCPVVSRRVRTSNSGEISFGHFLRLSDTCPGVSGMCPYPTCPTRIPEAKGSVGASEPARSLDFQTPLRVLSKFHFIPSVFIICLTVFACVCYVHVHSLHRDKLDPRAIKCVFLGYSNSRKGYNCFDPLTITYYVLMDVQFCEN